jgi:hypothetical protein
MFSRLPGAACYSGKLKSIDVLHYATLEDARTLMVPAAVIYEMNYS